MLSKIRKVANPVKTSWRRFTGIRAMHSRFSSPLVRKFVSSLLRNAVSSSTMVLQSRVSQPPGIPWLPFLNFNLACHSWSNVIWKNCFANFENLTHLFTNFYKFPKRQHLILSTWPMFHSILKRFCFKQIAFHNLTRSLNIQWKTECFS